LSSGEDLRHRLTARAARARVTVTDPTIDQIEKYFDLLARWNRTINLTALQLDPPTDTTVDRLLIEPLAAAAWIPDAPGRWMDLGSGGGSPALPLKIVRPRLALTMVEARERKAAFLREAARDLGLPDVDIVNERFESLKSRSDLIGRYTLVTARGVRIDSNVLGLARVLLAPGGRLFLFGSRDSALAKNSRFERMDVVNLGVDGSSLVILTNGY